MRHTRKVDPTRRIELTGAWEGYGFQQGHMWTPEGYSLYPRDMNHWALTCAIAREWRALQTERHPNAPRSQALVHSRHLRRVNASNIIYLRDVLREAAEEKRVLQVGDMPRTRLPK